MPGRKVAKKTKCGNRVRITARTRHDDLPATVGLVKEVRAELKADIKSLEHKMESGFARIVGRFAQVNSRFEQIDSRFAQVDGRFEQMDSRFEQLIAAVHRTQALMEEQRGENRIVLDGLKGLFDRQERVEKRVDGLEHTLHDLVTTKNRAQ